MSERKGKASSTTKAFFENHDLTGELLSFFPTLERFSFQTLTRECARCVEPITATFNYLSDPDKPSRRAAFAKFIVMLDNRPILLRHLTDQAVSVKDGYAVVSGNGNGFFLSDLITPATDSWDILMARPLKCIWVILQQFCDVIQVHFQLDAMDNIRPLMQGAIVFIIRRARADGKLDGLGDRFVSLFQHLCSGCMAFQRPNGVSLRFDGEIDSFQRGLNNVFWQTLMDPVALRDDEATEMVSVAHVLYTSIRALQEDGYTSTWFKGLAQDIKSVHRAMILVDQITQKISKGGLASGSRLVQYIHHHLRSILQDFFDAGNRKPLLEQMRDTLPQPSEICLQYLDLVGKLPFKS